MAIARLQGATCRIIQDRVLTLETEDRHGPDYKPIYGGIIIMKDKILVVDRRACNLQVYNRHDGGFIFTSVKMKGQPRKVCVINDTKFAVCLDSGTIVIMSLDSKDVVKQVKTFKVRAGFDFDFNSVDKWRSDNLIVSGWKSEDRWLFWAFVSVEDESFVSIHNICKGDRGSWTHVAVKHNTVYVSCCWAEDAINDNGVYAFDLPNLNHAPPRFVYQHSDLKTPWSITADSDYVFVCDWLSNSIHQLSDTGQLLAINRISSSNIREMVYDGDLYTTSRHSNVVKVYKIRY